MPRSMHWALFLTGVLWLIAARVAAEHMSFSLSLLLRSALLQPLFTEGLFLLFLCAGFTALHWIATRDGNFRRTNSLPKRATSSREWTKGAAIGWGMLLAAVIPMWLAHDLQPDFWLAPAAWGRGAMSLLALGFGTLAIELAFRGYLFRRLISSLGQTGASLLLSLLYAALLSLRGDASVLSFTVTFFAGLILSMAYLRTHALWLGWGLHFGWNAAMTLLFGLPLRGAVDYISVVSSNTWGPRWVTGGSYGPDGSLFSLMAILCGFVVLYRATRDYAWEYAFTPIVPGGYEVTVQPPAAHLGVEQASAGVPRLVQIAAVTPASPSTSLEIEKQLRGKLD